MISIAPEHWEDARQVIGDCPYTMLGEVADDVLRISVDGNEVINEPIASLETIWETALERSLGS